MSPETERLIKFLESLPTERRMVGATFDHETGNIVGGKITDVVRPSYLVATDRDLIVGALKFLAT